MPADLTRMREAKGCDRHHRAIVYAWQCDACAAIVWEVCQTATPEAVRLLRLMASGRVWTDADEASMQSILGTVADDEQGA